MLKLEMNVISKQVKEKKEKSISSIISTSVAHACSFN